MSNFDSVRKFMKTFGQEVKEKAGFPNEKITSLRYDLIKEELDEFKEALDKKDLKTFSAWDEFLHALNSWDKHNEVKIVEEKIKYVYEAIEHAEKSIALNKNLTDAYNILAGCLLFLRIESSLQHDREKNDARVREVA